MNTLILHIVTKFIRLLPESRCFKIKRKLLIMAGVQIGENTKICSSVRILGAGNLIIGNNVWIGPDVLISCGSNVMIEDSVDIAPRVYIGTGSHLYTKYSERAAGEGYNGDIIIKSGSWLCAYSVILPGKSLDDIRIIGKKCIVGAGAVVVSNIEDETCAVGVPAKKI